MEFSSLVFDVLSLKPYKREAGGPESEKEVAGVTWDKGIADGL